MKRIALLLSFVLLTPFVSPAATPSSDEVMTSAKAKAKAEHKAIFLHFGASWCIWCKRLDAFLEKPEAKPVVEKYLIPVKLVVSENAANKALENAGADALLKDLGGPAGLPYFAFLKADGSVIANSRMTPAKGGPAENIGYPGEPAEVDYFVKILRQAAPQITEDEVATLRKALVLKP